MVKADGQATGLCGVRAPSLNSAAEVMTFIVEPGATWAVSAKSLSAALLAMARIWPVDGWITIIELLLCMPTAVRAAASAFALIVVESVGKLPGAMSGACMFGTGLPDLVWISTSRPGLAPSLVGACAFSRPAMVSRPASL